MTTQAAASQDIRAGVLSGMATSNTDGTNNATGTMDERYYNNYTGELNVNGSFNLFTNNENGMGAELQAVGLFDESVLSANPYGMTENDYRDYFHMNPRDSYLPPKADEQ